MKPPSNKYNSEQIIEVTRLLKAMAHPERLIIVKLIDLHKTLNVTNIYTRLHLEQAIVSHHLTLLKSAGVLVAKKDGKVANYSLATTKVSALLTAIDKLIKV